MPTRGVRFHTDRHVLELGLTRDGIDDGTHQRIRASAASEHVAPMDRDEHRASTLILARRDACEHLAPRRYDACDRAGAKAIDAGIFRLNFDIGLAGVR